MTSQYWGVTLWDAKPGQEDEFAARWTALVSWTVKEFPGSGPGRLSQDPDEPTRFSSVYGWERREQVEDWKSRPEFIRMWAEMEETLLKSDRRTYTLHTELT